MKSNTNKRPGLRPPRVGQVAVIVLVTCLSSYCTSPDKQTNITVLSEDETYLVASYTRVATARDMIAVTPLKSESLFAAFDSTIDNTRIANTIRRLNMDPDRWIAVYQAIERGLKSTTGEVGEAEEGKPPSEQTGR